MEPKWVIFSTQFGAPVLQENRPEKGKLDSNHNEQAELSVGLIGDEIPLCRVQQLRHRQVKDDTAMICLPCALVL